MNARTKHAVTTLSVGLVLNIALGAAKLAAGIISGSASVTSDAVNNISDAAVAIVTIAATCFAARGADHDHPNGHGRYEYIATMLLGAVIIAVGAEVFVGGIKRVIAPQAVTVDALMFWVLGVSIGVKAFMAALYGVHGKRVGSDTVKAAAVDSLSDVAVTSVVLIGAIVERFTAVRIDGYVSVAVSLVILIMGLRIVKRTVSRLLGERPDPKLQAEVLEIIGSNPEVISVHDLMINDYGESNKTAEADAVFDAQMRFVDVHRICDAVEREVLNKTGVRLCLHADPVEKSDTRLATLQTEIDGILNVFGAAAHDIDISDENKTVLLDIAVGSDETPTEQISETVKAKVRQHLPDYDVEVHIDF